MQLNKSHVQYALAQFDAGISPHQILLELQYRAFLPSINVATIERCIRDNGRVLTDQQQTDNASQGNQSLGINQASHPLPPASQGAPGPFAATQESGLFPIEFTTKAFPSNFGLGPMKPWDAMADRITLAEYRAMKPVKEIWMTLRIHAYHITQLDILNSLIRQGAEGVCEIMKEVLRNT